MSGDGSDDPTLLDRLEPIGATGLALIVVTPVVYALLNVLASRSIDALGIATPIPCGETA